MRRAHHALPFRGGGVSGLLALAFAFASAGCTKTVLYTYVSVHVTIDASTLSNDQLSQVNTCLFRVTGAETSQARNIRCPAPEVHDIGTFEWETQIQQGALAFVAQIFDLNQVLIGQGTSESVPISPGKHLATSVLVVGVQPPSPDGGTMMMADAATPDGADASTANDGGVDAMDGATVGLASDGSTTTDAGISDAATTDLPTDAGTTDGATIDLPTDLATGDMTGDAGTPTDGGTDTDGQSGDGASNATTDGNTDGKTDGPEAG